MRKSLLAQVKECEICGNNEIKRLYYVGNNLCCHEILGGSYRSKYLDEPCGILVVCYHCNSQLLEDHSEWPMARQLAVLKEKRPEHYDLRRWLEIRNPNAPNYITEEEVHEMGKKPEIENANWLTIKQIMEQCEVTRPVVVSWIQSGELKFTDMRKSGGKYHSTRVSREALDSFLEKREESAQNLT